jgi:predicted ATPase
MRQAQPVYRPVTAEKAVGKLKDGVWLVDLTLINAPALLPNAIATVMDLAVHSSDMLGSLCHLLRDHELLLVLDSCEHMIDAAAACADQILKHAASVRVIATSREPLRVIDERVRRLPVWTHLPTCPA